ncbi:MAG: glyceraldehyde 3-phosphate dehydrogenase NAD-binding domain-containing protein [Nanoarchaeota archaeon]
MVKKQFGINGFGRIGRAIFRKALENGTFDIPLINDLNPDNNNLAYQLKYDSIYGTLPFEIRGNEKGITIEGKQYEISHEREINKVNWKNLECVVDSSGVKENVVLARKLVEQNVKYVIVTHSPEEKLLDRSVIMGVNENEIDFNKDRIISSSICDATAFAPVVQLLDSAYGVEHGFLTTIHPWLQHQHLLDGPSTSWSKPGQIYPGYEEGRASTVSLLPKPTSCVSATCKVIKSLEGKFDSFSYRAPTAIVSTANINLKLNKNPSKEEIISLFLEAEKNQKWKIFSNNFEPLVSIDFKGNEHSVSVDHRWTAINKFGYARLVLWYDNEQGYGSRVLDLADYLLSH